MRRLLPIALFIACAACVPQRQWRTQPLYSGTAPGAAVEERFVIPPDLTQNRIYSLAFMEFMNNGDAWDKRQLDEALHAIDDADQRSGHRALVICFIHGWKNNASQKNANIYDFRRQLNRIAADACKGDKEHCGVVGIYLGWSGDSIDRNWNDLRQLTYFNRRGTAEQVAVNNEAVASAKPAASASVSACEAPICSALFSIMSRAKLGSERATNHSIVVGHSFGGLILEYAISKRMKQLGEELHTELGKQSTSDEIRLKTLSDFADLVVLINQAAPAAHAVTLLSEFREDLQKVNLLRPPRNPNCQPGDSSQDCKDLTRPLILSVSSETDLATRAILPVAETISHGPRVLPPGVKLPEGLDLKQVFTTAPAHTAPLYSHALIECVGGDCNPCLKHDKFYIPVSITLPAYAPGNQTNHDTPIKYCLVRDFAAWNRTPYWIFHIPEAVVPDHGTIFTDRFTDFLTSFMPPLEAFRTSQPALPPTQRLQRKGSG